MEEPDNVRNRDTTRANASATLLKWFDAFSNSEKRPRCSAGGGSGITSIGDNAYCDLEQVELSEDGLCRAVRTHNPVEVTMASLLQIAKKYGAQVLQPNATLPGLALDAAHAVALGRASAEDADKVYVAYLDSVMGARRHSRPARTRRKCPSCGRPCCSPKSGGASAQAVVTGRGNAPRAGSRNARQVIGCRDG